MMSRDRYSRPLLISAAFCMALGASTTITSAANDSEVLECYWLKEQARKLKTEEAWRKYRECVRSHG